MERVNWIDWAKATAVVTVVFCHLPQSQEWFYYRYLQAVIITVFFFLSGYLKKDRDSWHANSQKYLYALVVPYILLNTVVYPFWLLKFTMIHGDWPTLTECLKPIAGALLLQHEASYCTHLNGPLWYLPAVLLMHLLTDLSRRTPSPHLFMTVCCIASVVLYAACKYWDFAHSLTPIGFFRRLPFYYLGYVMGRRQLLHAANLSVPLLRWKGRAPATGTAATSWQSRPASPCATVIPLLLLSTVSILLSLLVFYWHLHEQRFVWHIALFYPVCLLFLSATVFSCQLADSLHQRMCHGPVPTAPAPMAPAFVSTLSVGTLIVIGLHEQFITVANYMVRLCWHTDSTPIYHWYQALPLALAISALLYPVIILSKRYFPLLMGR